MRLDFNETNILVQALSDLERQPDSKISKDKLLNFLYALYSDTNDGYIFIRNSIKTLISKIETLSDDDLVRIRNDKNDNKIIATAGYALPPT